MFSFFGLVSPKCFNSFGILSSHYVPDEGYSRNASCVLIWLSTASFHVIDIVLLVPVHLHVFSQKIINLSLPKYFEKHFFQVTVIILLVQEINGKSVFFRQIEIVLKVVLEASRISNSNIFKCRCSMSQLLSLLPEIPRLLGTFPQKRQRK